MKHKCDGCKYKGEHQEMMFRPFWVCTRETNLIDAEKAYKADKCPYKKTNADRIRAMTDEELTQLFTPRGCPTDSHRKCIEWSCKDCWNYWLQQPAEGD